MESITDYFPYENSDNFDINRTLKWSNETIINAIKYYESVCGVKISYDDILVELRSGTLRSIQALLFAALKTADPKMTAQRFSQIYKNANLPSYINAVLDGMSHYLPEPTDKDQGENLDPDWPDTQEELKKKGSDQLPSGGTGSGSARKRAKTSKSKR